MNIRALDANEASALLPQLCGVLVDCVDGGASVSFMAPFGVAEAEPFWQGVISRLSKGDLVLFVAEDENGVHGTVQLVLAMPPNQPHRAEISKLLVHRRARCRGIGQALMRAAEREAAARGRSLIVLDTADPGAERLYERLGWQRVGVIPGYALLPDGRPCDTVVFYRHLADGAP